MSDEEKSSPSKEDYKRWVKDVQKEIQWFSDNYHKQLEQLTQLKSENQRMREALEEIASVNRVELLNDPEYWGNAINSTASAALGVEDE